MKKFLTLAFFILFLTITPLVAQSLDYDKLAPHPRLLLSQGDIGAMKEFATNSTNAKAVNSSIVAFADEILGVAPVERKMTGRRLLSVSREVLKRVFYLSYAYLTTDDKRYAQRAEQEMLAVSHFNDWNPSHFLDVGEMTLALAIGYDWLYHYLPVRSRSIIGTAIYEKGLLASENSSHAWFFRAENNWNQVCNAGMIYGALATMERSPEYCKALIAKCLESNPLAQKSYEPDGVYPEGYAYWDYGTGFEVLLAAALQSALGTDAGISKQKSFMRSASYMTYMAAPSGQNYNYYDSGNRASANPAKYWFARELNDPSIVAIDEKLLREKPVPMSRLLPLYMVFGSKLDLKAGALPKSKCWSGDGIVPLFIYREGWNSPTDTYFAIKGGKANNPHGHMGAGAFIYEYDGVRWAVELGQHDYNRLEQAGVDLWNMSQQSSRWDIFRIGAESHNTLTFNGERHNVAGMAKLVNTFEEQRERGATIDMTEVFTPHAKSVVRKALIDKNDYLVITDLITNGDQPSMVEWKMATNAEAEIITPNVIALTQDGKTLYLKLRTKATAEAKVWNEHNYKEYEIRDENLRRVGFSIALQAGEEAELEVTLSPEKAKKIKLPSLRLNSRKKDK